MGPKKSKTSAHPYNKAPRQSTRKTRRPVRPGEESEGEIVAPEPAQVNHDNPEPQPSTSQQGQHDRDTPQHIDIPEPPQNPIQVNSIPVPQPQVVEQVSRNEFVQLRDSVTSMKDMFSSFMNRFSPQQSQSGQLPTNSIPFQQPPSVPVSQPIISQPSTSNNNDPNLPSSSNNLSVADFMANNILSQAVATHINSVSAEQAIGKPTTDKVSYQLDRKIPPSIMQDIWEDKYVDLEVLLDNKVDPDAPMVFKSVHTDEYGQIVQMVKPKQPKGIVSIQLWSYAFDIYMSVYTRKHKNETHNLLTYSNKVKEVASKGGDYLRYDEEFRKSRARYGTPWETPDLELLVECNQAGLQDQIIKILNSLNKSPASLLPNIQTNNQSFLPTDNTPTPPTQDQKVDTPRFKHPPGACYTFHNSGRCGRANCRFSHLCYVSGCGQEHAVYSCPKNNPTRTQPSKYPGPGLSPSTHLSQSSNPSHPGTAK